MYLKWDQVSPKRTILSLHDSLLYISKRLREYLNDTSDKHKHKKIACHY
jgi:hypothetical protein